MKLSGWAFIVVGIAVAIASYMLMGSGQKMMLFAYTGIAMAVFGAIRLYLDRGLPKTQTEHRANLERQLPSQRHNTDIPKICTVCHSRNNPQANFCGYCGNRL